ncbi:MAG: HNH endonuclease, partial [Thermosynechococcaceae cyanobacterium]
HVHHIKPISEIGESYIVDPVTDLIPVCPNCHAVIHLKSSPYTPEEVSTMLHNAQELAQANNPGAADFPKLFAELQRSQ